MSVLAQGAPRNAAGWLVGAAVLGLGTAAVAGDAAGLGALRVLVLLLIAPLAEETLLRAGLHDALLRRGLAPVLVNGLTAAAFGLAHVAVRGDPAALAVVLPALLIGAVYQRWQRLRWCVALHAAMNAVWMGAGLLSSALLPGLA